MALEELNNSDYEIKDGEPDITGWNVLNQNGEKWGEVEDLLFDPEARKVRYLIVGLQANGNDILDDKFIAVPIGVAQLQTEEDDVILPVRSGLELTNLPAYLNRGLTPEDEVQIRQVFGGSTAPYEHPQFYTHEHFNEGRFYNRNQPDNSTIIPAEDMDRAERTDRIMERIRQTNDEPKSTDFPQGKIVSEYESPANNTTNQDDEIITSPGFTTESLERENSQPVEETGDNDYRINEGLVPEPESFEQEEAWDESQDTGSGQSRLMEFFINELKDLLWAERELAETLPNLAEAATSAELKTAFSLHETETQTHISRIEQAFALLGLAPDSRKCDAMAGILDEGDEIISATEDGTAQRDVGLIFAGQKAEHYEIASYGGMIALAKTLGYYDIAELFVLTLDEEKTADAKLTEIAENQANYDASREQADE